jgi:hypothetical protein
MLSILTCGSSNALNLCPESQPLDWLLQIELTSSMMAQISLPSPWQRDNVSLHSIDAINIKKRKLETNKINANNSQNKPPTNHVTTHNRFAILESTDDTMDIVETPTNQHTQRIPPPPPINIDDVIDIRTMVKSIEKDIRKEDYNLKINNNKIKILPVNPTHAGR